MITSGYKIKYDCLWVYQTSKLLIRNDNGGGKINKNISVLTVVVVFVVSTGMKLVQDARRCTKSHSVTDSESGVCDFGGGLHRVFTTPSGVPRRRDRVRGRLSAGEAVAEGTRRR